MVLDLSVLDLGNQDIRPDKGEFFDLVALLLILDLIPWQGLPGMKQT